MPCSTRETSLSKPLISDSTLHGMYSAMQHLAAEKREAGLLATLSRADRAALQGEPEAVLAALFSQLHRRDTVLTQGTHPLAQTAVDAWFAHTGAPTLHAVQASAETCAAIAAGIALRIRDKAAILDATDVVHRAQPVVVALLREFQPFVSPLRLMQQCNLPIVLVISGAPEPRVEVQRRQHFASVPVMPVDRDDAVAMCRVVQECLLRARNGWGGTVIHALRLPGAQNSLDLLRQHLQKRGMLDVAGIDGHGIGKLKTCPL